MGTARAPIHRIAALLSAVTLAAVLCPRTALAEVYRSGTLTVDVSGFENTTGVINIRVFDSPSAWMRRPAYEASLNVDGRRAVWKIRDVPHGDYAVAVFHDENSNGKSDTTIFGTTKEPNGFSNDGRCIAGPPSWSTARVPFYGHESTLPVRVRRP